MTATEAGVSHTNGGAGVLAELYVLLGITLLMVVARSYVSISITRLYDAADITILIATAFLIVGTVFCTIEVDLGLGQHLSSLKNPEYQALQIRRWNTYWQITNVWTTLFTKFSIAFFILRIKKDRAVKIVLGVMMVSMTLATIACVVVLSISCTPLEKLWKPTVKGTCLDLQLVYIVSYVQSAFTIVCDLILTISPMVILWNVRIRKGRKTFIVFLMSLGLVATFSNALRNACVSELTSPDFTYAIIKITVLAILEQCSGIIAACVPACVPLMKRTQKRRKMVRMNESPSYYFPQNEYKAFGSDRDAIFTSTSVDSSSEAVEAHSLTELDRCHVRPQSTIESVSKYHGAERSRQMLA